MSGFSTLFRRLYGGGYRLPAWKKYPNSFLDRLGEHLGGLGGGSYDVTHYGATGDGTTDDTAAIQAAIDAAEAAGGGTVNLPPGIYKVTPDDYDTPIFRIKAPITIMGPEGAFGDVSNYRPYQGAATQPVTPTIDSLCRVVVDPVGFTGAVFWFEANDIAGTGDYITGGGVQNMVIFGSSRMASGIVFNHCSWMKVRRVHMGGFASFVSATIPDYRYAIVFDNASAFNVVEDFSAGSSGIAGIIFLNGDGYTYQSCTQNKFTRLTCVYGDAPGIHLYGNCDNNIFHECHMIRTSVDSTGHGVFFESKDSSNKVRHNVFNYFVGTAKFGDMTQGNRILNWVTETGGSDIVPDTEGLPEPNNQGPYAIAGSTGARHETPSFQMQDEVRIGAGEFVPILNGTNEAEFKAGIASGRWASLDFPDHATVAPKAGATIASPLRWDKGTGYACIRHGATTGWPWTVGETITGGTSGATAVLQSKLRDGGGTGFIYYDTLAGGPFEIGETVTGGTSGATTAVRSLGTARGIKGVKLLWSSDTANGGASTVNVDMVVGCQQPTATGTSHGIDHTETIVMTPNAAASLLHITEVDFTLSPGTHLTHQHHGIVSVTLERDVATDTYAGKWQLMAVSLTYEGDGPLTSGTSGPWAIPSMGGV